MGLINGFYGQNNVYYWSHKDKPEEKKETSKAENKVSAETQAPKTENENNIAASPNYGLEYYAGNVHYNKSTDDENNGFNKEAFLQNLEWLKQE